MLVLRDEVGQLSFLSSAWYVGSFMFCFDFSTAFFDSDQQVVDCKKDRTASKIAELRNIYFRCCSSLIRVEIREKSIIGQSRTVIGYASSDSLEEEAINRKKEKTGNRSTQIWNGRFKVSSFSPCTQLNYNFNFKKSQVILGKKNLMSESPTNTNIKRG